MQAIKEILLADLDEVYSSIVAANNREGRVMTRRQICDIISKSPAPRLYITPEYAMRILRGHPRCGARTHSYRVAAMQQEMRSRVLALPENQRSLADIAKAIAEPAQSFYLSSRRIYDFLYQVYNRRKQSPSSID